MKIWYFYAVMTVVTWGLWGVFSKLASNYTKPRQALLFQTVGVIAFALLVLVLENYKIEWNLAGFQASRAAFTARSTSFAFACGIFAKSFPVAGLLTSICSFELLSTHFPR